MPRGCSTSIAWGERLGGGGMGDVYLAEHRMLKRPCAVKLIRQEHLGDAHTLARFEREVRATAQLSHWNTILIFDYGRNDDGVFYYAMEYLPGLSLDNLVRRYGPMPPARVIYLLRQACDALHKAHEAGLVHRDIKPANLFAAYRGGHHDVAKLLDFGLVKTLQVGDGIQLSREDTIAGSPLYIAPEQVVHNQPPDRRADIYSIGAVAYYLLTGHPPFMGESAMEVMVAHMRDPVVSPTQVRPEVARTWRRWCCAAWPSGPPIAIRTRRAWPRPWPTAPTPRAGRPSTPRRGGGTTRTPRSPSPTGPVPRPTREFLARPSTGNRRPPNRPRRS